MCDKPSCGDMKQISPPKTAHELLLEKQSKTQSTMWFNGEHCSECEAPIYTDGKLEWCKAGCGNNGTRGIDREGYMGFISDIIR